MWCQWCLWQGLGAYGPREDLFVDLGFVRRIQETLMGAGGSVYLSLCLSLCVSLSVSLPLCLSLSLCLYYEIMGKPATRNRPWGIPQDRGLKQL